MRPQFLGRGRTVFAAALFAGAALTGTAPHAGAQYPPPPINAECHILQVVGAPTTTQGGRIVVPFQGTIQVAAAPECAQSGEEVEIWAQSHLIRIHDGFNAAADGSYTSPPIQLPAHLAPGPHQIRPRHLQSNVEYFCPILVVDAATDTATAPLAAGGGGALRPASSNGGGGGGGGGGRPASENGREHRDARALRAWADRRGNDDATGGEPPSPATQTITAPVGGSASGYPRRS